MKSDIIIIFEIGGKIIFIYINIIEAIIKNLDTINKLNNINEIYEGSFNTSNNDLKKFSKNIIKNILVQLLIQIIIRIKYL